MPPRAGRGAQKQAPVRAGGGGRGRGGGKGGADGLDRSMDLGKELEQLEDSSVSFQSSLEILRGERADKRLGRSKKHDTVREDEGVDEDDPLINIDDGIRIEPFNMRREMNEGHFDEGGMYIVNKDLEKEVTDAWLDTVDSAARTAMFAQEKRLEKSKKIAETRISALKRNLGKDDFPEEDADEELVPEGDDGSWTIEIDRTSGGRLGIGLDVKPSEADGDRIEIEDIGDGGLLAAWNEANPTKMVQAGDRILELNGESTTEAITGGLGKLEVIRIKFIREEKPEEPEEEKDTATMIEALVGDLLPLESPTQALARFCKSGSAASGRSQSAAAASGPEPLRMRARIKKDRAAEASRKTPRDAGATAAAGATVAADATAAADAQRPTRRRLNEWGDYEAGATPSPAAAAEASGGKRSLMPAEPAAAEAGAAPSPAAAPAAAEAGAAPSLAAAPAAAEATGDAGGPATAIAATDSSEQGAAADASAASSSSVLVDKDAAVAAAAEKVAATEKVNAEAAKVVAADARSARWVLHMDVDPAQGPEAAALLSAKESEARKSEAAANAEAVTHTTRKRVLEPGILEQARRKKIERLTDLCDRLLERGVLVYESTREQLAIEVRERRGEFEKKDGEKDGAANGTATDSKEEAVEKPAAGAEAKETAQAPAAGGTATAPSVPVFVNKRLTSAASPTGDSGGLGLLGLLSNEGASESTVDPEAKGANPSAGLLWQFRWDATPELIHGPFDSVSMHGWMMQGCFESKERRAEVRQCDSANVATEQCWHTMMEVNFGLYL